jgi:hypothetical protein
VGKLSSAPIFIDDTPAISVLEIRANSRKLLLECVVFTAMAADEVRSAAAHAPCARGCNESVGHARVIGEAEVVVAAERQALAPVHAHTLRSSCTRLHQAAPAVAMRGRLLRKTG